MEKLKKVKKYKINLDVEPNIRWKEVINDHIDKLPKIIEYFDNILNNIPNGSIIKTFAWASINTFNKLNYVMYSDELNGISNITKIPLYKLVLVQLCYEMFASCTSVGFPLLINGNYQNIHFRTMDWDMSFLKDITIEVEFIKNNKTLFIATTWVGCIGVFTALAPNKFSIALNYRYSSGTFFDNLKKTLSLKWPVSYLIRQVLTMDMNIDDTIKMLSNSKLISPCYINIVSAIGNNVTLVRDAESLVEKIENTTIIQTNNDKISTKNILYSNERKKLAQEIIQNLKANNYYDIIKEFYKFPIINEETVYINIIDPKNNILLTYI